ncbi:fungal-specific transcription factor domain-containing protein [Penicillium longicatenatum]|uniref:fungal-specific transcription factor domain-containing protein n=1 Tax=Penicillium longicatenatum TaxID=1561947 RepID=UPI002546D7EF|nr:fungal-specific transcription factor domain-containing protein [Penicillium longicatenatum]KAJ5630371.1 fungal-specific transcription factor domain-containing protein [Penicillium longicatenatum]
MSRSSTGSDGLQPSGVLSHEAMKGRFSLRYILGSGENERPERHEGDHSGSLDDPIRLGLINISIAQCLFDHFITVFNPYISQLDPALHTFSYVRRKSSFLLSTILASSAKAFNPTFYPKLHEHAESLLAKNFLSGIKTTEIAQGTLILTYWKEPRDTRAWVLLGYVIRMCTDMGWHKFLPSQSQNHTMSESERRETRNKERTWFLLFVYDRSMSLQTGRPWMIERDEFIESIETWCNDPLATRHDPLLGAFVTLRILTSEAVRLLNPQSWEGKRAKMQGIELQLDFINTRIRKWEKQWTRKIKALSTSEENCHEFLIRFYGSHIILQLSSLPLQVMLSSGASEASLDLGTFWMAYSSALSMLKLISDFSAHIYFVQDSIHVMNAYSGAFLVKLAHAVPETIAKQIRPEIIKAIREATAAFSSQGAPDGSTCVLQAQFLGKIAARLSEMDTPRQNDPILTDLNIFNGRLDTVETPIRDGRFFKNGTQEASQQYDMAAAGASLQEPEAFMSDDYWAHVFASAGFNTDDGIFLA